MQLTALRYLQNVYLHAIQSLNHVPSLWPWDVDTYVHTHLHKSEFKKPDMLASACLV